MPLEAKIILSKNRIREWYNYFNGRVYVSFSGGKDSTVLLHLVRELYPEVEAVFVDTGLEYPEIKDFVNTINNVRIIRPKMPFFKVIEKHGYPMISKSVSMAINRYQNTKSEVQKQLRLYGGINPTSGRKQVMGVIPKKYHYILDHDIKISERCCDVMKKTPFKVYEKETGKKPFIGIMSEESNLRKMEYLKHGCNAFNKKKPQSCPLSFWTDQDILKYIKKINLNYSSIYGEIKTVKEKMINSTIIIKKIITGKRKLVKWYHSEIIKIIPRYKIVEYLTTGEKRTGCMFCLYGVHLEKSPNRFERMKKTHPKVYDYCINGNINLKKPLEILGVNY